MLSNDAAPRWRTVLFDLDGVLVDSRTPIARCLNLGLEGVGLEPEPEERLHGFIGEHLDPVYRQLLSERGADPERAPECIEHYRLHYRDRSLRDTTVFAGIPALLDRLTPRSLGVATAKPVEYAAPIVETLGLAPRFATVSGPPLASTHTWSKADVIARALDTIGERDTSRAVMVGDRSIDIEAGQAHGLVTIGVRWGIGDDDELRSAGADYLADSPDALLGWIERGG